MLSKQDMNAGEIAEHFQMSKPAISKHLDILKNSDLISCEKQGQYVVYSINTTAVQNIYRKFLEDVYKRQMLYRFRTFYIAACTCMNPKKLEISCYGL